MGNNVQSSSAVTLAKPKRKRKGLFGQLIILVILLLGSVTMIIPLVWMVMTSFDWAARLTIPFPPRFWPEIFSLKTYELAFTNIPLLRYMFNSFVVSAGVIIVSLISSLLSGYAISQLKFKGSNFVLIVSMCTMMIPFEMTMIPQYLMFGKLHLLDSYWSFFLPALNYAFGTFLAKTYFDKIPGSLREAARIDGASELTVFIKIFLPLSVPIIATLTILQFLNVWNDLLWPLLALKSPDKYTIQLGLAMFSYNKALPLPSIIMAATTVSILPVVLTYMFLQRYIIDSIASSGMK